MLHEIILTDKNIIYYSIRLFIVVRYITLRCLTILVQFMKPINNLLYCIYFTFAINISFSLNEGLTYYIVLSYVHIKTHTYVHVKINVCELCYAIVHSFYLINHNVNTKIHIIKG